MSKQFVMLSGLPRSGSTVLSSMLNQHPLIYASTTSPVVDLIDIANQHWRFISSAYINRDPNQYPNMIKGICLGAYEHIDKPVIIDKNRLWPRMGTLMYSAFKQKPKIICTVRDITEILASYVTLINKNSNKITFIDQELIDNNQIVNNKNRCKILIHKFINNPWTSLRVGYNLPEVDLCIVEYNDIVDNSQKVMDKICDFIGIESYNADTNNLQQMDENDNFHGGIDGLHSIRPVMERVSLPPEKIIGSELTNLYKNAKMEFWRK